MPLFIQLYIYLQFCVISEEDLVMSETTTTPEAQRFTTALLNPSSRIICRVYGSTLILIVLLVVVSIFSPGS